MIHIFIDTNKLYDAGMGFGNGDFRKLLVHSKEGNVKLYIPFICWEERRTQIFEDALQKNKALQAAYSEFSASKNLFLASIQKPPMPVVDEESLRNISRESMDKFAEDHGIQILELGGDHAQRAWKRYFEVHPPFNRDEPKREIRRKDIPDSWILESAIDLNDRYDELIVFGKDGALTKAIAALGIEVVKEYAELFEKINHCIAPISTAVIETPTGTSTDDELEKALLVSQQDFMALEKRILGYISYLDPANKEELFELLSKQGIEREISENIAQKLVFTDAISDSGNNYLIKNKPLCELAASEIEEEIARILLSDKS